MKYLLALLSLTIAAFGAFPSYAQRVSQIKQVTHSRWQPHPDTTTTEFIYQDTLLTTIEQKRGTKLLDRYTVDYRKDKVIISDQKGKLYKSFIYDKDTPRRISEYWNDPYDQYEFTYAQSGNTIQRIDGTDEIDKYKSANEFIYENGRLVRMKTWNKKADRSSSVDYVVYYANGQIDRVVWGNHIRLYELDWSDSQVSTVLYSENKKPRTKHSFAYDPAGRITEQREYSIADGEEKIYQEYFITYQDQAGNDEMLFDLYHWQYNLILGIKTFAPFKQQRY